MMCTKSAESHVTLTIMVHPGFEPRPKSTGLLCFSHPWSFSPDRVYRNARHGVIGPISCQCQSCFSRLELARGRGLSVSLCLIESNPPTTVGLHHFCPDGANKDEGLSLSHWTTVVSLHAVTKALDFQLPFLAWQLSSRLQSYTSRPTSLRCLVL